jgi:hypothetical protein
MRSVQYREDKDCLADNEQCRVDIGDVPIEQRRWFVAAITVEITESQLRMAFFAYFGSADFHFFSLGVSASLKVLQCL